MRLQRFITAKRNSIRAFQRTVKIIPMIVQKQIVLPGLYLEPERIIVNATTPSSKTVPDSDTNLITYTPSSASTISVRSRVISGLHPILHEFTRLLQPVCLGSFHALYIFQRESISCHSGFMLSQLNHALETKAGEDIAGDDQTEEALYATVQPKQHQSITQPSLSVLETKPAHLMIFISTNSNQLEVKDVSWLILFFVK